MNVTRIKVKPKPTGHFVAQTIAGLSVKNHFRFTSCRTGEKQDTRILRQCAWMAKPHWRASQSLIKIEPTGIPSTNQESYPWKIAHFSNARAIGDYSGYFGRLKSEFDIPLS